TDDDFTKKGAFEVLSFEIGAENNVNIGSISGGAGAGKASFKELNFTKKTDTASCAMFNKLCVGEHFAEFIIELRRQSGTAAGKGASGLTFLKWEFKLVMIQDIAWSGSDGDDVCEETVVAQFGAMKVTYVPQNQDGSPNSKDKKVTEWSRVKNKATYAV
ncbi:MAG: type VI secretion system tube protein Hcp, partial [Pseudomonadota bacterium]